jgi:hypothetical protein
MLYNTHISDPYYLTPICCYYRPLVRFRTISHPPTVFWVVGAGIVGTGMLNLNSTEKTGRRVQLP